MRGLTLIAGALGLLAAPVVWKYLNTDTGEPAFVAQAAAETPEAAPTLAEAEPAPVTPERREVAGGAVFVTARD